MMYSFKNTDPSSSPAISSSNLFGCTSGIQQIQLFGITTSSASLHAPPFGFSVPCDGTFAFNAAKNATSGQTQNIYPGSSSTSPTFGKKYEGNNAASVSDSSVFGSPKAPAFGVASNSHFGTPGFDSYSFGQPAVSTSGSKGKESTTPLLKSSDLGKSAFRINQKGSRIASYIATPEKDRTSGGKIQSICGMHTYKDKSQEELRFEDYQLDDKGQKSGFSFGVSGTQGFRVIDNTRPFKSPTFNQSTGDQPFYSHFPSTFAVKRAGVDSLSNENPTTTAYTPFPKSQQSIPHISPKKTLLFNSSGTGSSVESTASGVPFSPWIHSRTFAPLKPASSSSTFSPLTNPWASSTSSTPSLTQSLLSPYSVSPSTYPLLAKPSGRDFDQKNSFSPTPVFQSIGLENLCTSCQLSRGYPLASSQNTPEMTPNIGATLPTTIASHPSKGASCSEIGQGVGQPHINGQQSYFPRIMEVKPSPIMLPAETQPSVQISVEHLNLATSIPHGISSLPVSNKPSPVRRKSSLIIRHSSLSQHRLPLQKYKPTSDKPKVPFFMDKENASGLPTTEVVIIPRENPRNWVRLTTKEFSLGADSCELSQLKHTSMDRIHDGEKVDDNPNLAPEEMHYDNCGQLKHCFQVSLGSADEAGTDDRDVDAIMPKLQRADYYSVPPIKELISKEKEEAGFCCHVKEFVVGRHGYGSIKFLGETDVRKLDLDSAVHFNCREVIIYMDESKKPPVGQGLNKPAEITLLNVRCINKSTGKEYKDGPAVNKYRDMLIKKAVEQGAEFVSYDPVEGQWKFRVSHF